VYFSVCRCSYHTAGCSDFAIVISPYLASYLAVNQSFQLISYFTIVREKSEHCQTQLQQKKHGIALL